MARPVTTRKNSRVQVSAQTNTPGLDVVAPMDVQTAPGGHVEGWGALQRALGVAGRVYADHKQRVDAEDYEQGMADQRLGKVDQERLERQGKYADGAFKATVITQTSAAIAEIEERAATEIPNASVEEKMQWIDAQLMQELGPLAQDPKARREIHEQVQDYLEKVAGRETAINRHQNRATMVEAFSVKVNQALEGAAFDISALVNEGAPLFDGGRTEAWQVIVDQVATRAEEQNDETILKDLLPHKVTTEDGQTIDSPVSSKTNKARIELARARIEKYRREKEAPMREWTYAQVLRDAEDRIEQGELLSLAEFEDDILADRMTAVKANELVNRSVAKIASLKEEAELYDTAMQVRVRAQSNSWWDTKGSPGGPKTAQDVQDLVDETAVRHIKGYAAANGIDVPPLSGIELAKPEFRPLRNKLIQMTVDERLPVTMIKSYMTGFNPAMGGTVVARLDTYEVMKAFGVTDKYLDDDQAALFEMALTAQRAGESPESVIKTIQRTADPAIRTYVAENRDKANKLALTGDWNVINKYLDVGTKDMANLPLVQSKLRALAQVGLSRSMSPMEAATWAHERFAETHYAVKLNGKAYVIPQAKDVDPAEVTVALEKFSAAASAVAKAEGDPNPGAARMAVSFGRNGRDVEVFYVGSDGGEIGDALTIPAVIQQAKALKGSFKFSDAVNTYREADKKRRRREQQLYNQATRLFPAGMK